MERANEIIFENFKSTKKGFRFFYQIDNDSYSFWISIDHKKINLDESSKELVLFHIGLSFLIDISVITCPKKIIIKPFFLSDKQLQFWKWLYKESSLERAYIEKEELFFLDTAWENSDSCESPKMFKKKKAFENITISMSGGKESLTALKLFKTLNPSLFFFDYNDKNSFHMRKAYNVLKKGYDYFQINTNIAHTDKLTKKYKSKDYSLSVIPQLIFNSLLYSDKIDYLIIGNEYSSNFGNAEYKGRTVNHQYDKTIHFANMINNYIKIYFNDVIKYTSPFFGMYEYKIAEHFFSDSDFLDIWTSCNNSNSKHNFCCECPKCAFIHIISLPFVEKNFLDQYFFKNPLENLKLCKPLIDIDSEKPTDCVGEKKECWVALTKIIQQQKALDSKVIQYFQKTILPVIKNDLFKMEFEITTNQMKKPHLPKKLIECLPANFFNYYNPLAHMKWKKQATLPFLNV